MAGTKAGAIKAQQNRIQNLMDDYKVTYEEAVNLYHQQLKASASLGGKKSTTGGFAQGEEGRRRAQIAGRRGGKAKKRRHSD